MRARPLRAAVPLVWLGLAGLAAACGDSLGLPKARFENTVDTVTLYAIDGTPLDAPSAYDVEFLQRVILYQTSRFDFAFNILSGGQAVLLPTGALGLGKASGIRIESKPFDAVTEAATSGYADSTAVGVDSGTVAVVRSRPASVTCTFGVSLPLYAKIEVLAIDTTVRSMKFKILVDQNCGYRGLQPGVPTR
jgi:hypothetical protein